MELTAATSGSAVGLARRMSVPGFSGGGLPPTCICRVLRPLQYGFGQGNPGWRPDGLTLGYILTSPTETKNGTSDSIVRSQNRLRQRAVSIAASPHDSKGVTLNAASGRSATAFMPWDRSLNQDPGGGLPPTMTVFCPSQDARGTALGTNK